MKRRIFIVSAAVFSLAAHSQVADINDAVNKAGRQRMLSQRMSKAYLALVEKIEAGSAQLMLDRSVALFDRQLAELKAFAPAADIRETYVKLEGAWSDFKGVLTARAPSRDQVATVIQMDVAPALANQGTQEYERASGKSLAKLVNIAGRQRMLSQRMAKFYLAGAMQIDPKGSAAEIGKSRAEFVAALETLRNAPEATPKVREELALADAQWIFFDQGLQRMDGARQAPKLLSDVFVASENLLSVMDRVTGLYSASHVAGA